MVKNIIRSTILMVLSLVAVSCQNNEPEQDVVYKQLSESEFKYTDESIGYCPRVPREFLVGKDYEFDYYFNIQRRAIRVTDGKVELKIDFVKNKSKIDSVYVYESILASSATDRITKLPVNILVSEIPIIKYTNFAQIDKDWYSIKITDESCIIRIKENKLEDKRYLYVGFIGKAITTRYDAMVGNLDILQY